MRVETFHTPGPVRVDVRVPTGRVDIETVDGEETRVEIESEPEAEEAAVIELRGNEVTVAIEEERFLVFFTKVPDAIVRITCPHGSELDGKVVSADLRVNGRLGSADVKSVSGDLQLDQVDGEATVKTVSGDGRLGPVAGRADLKTVSGDFAVERVDGPVEFRSVSGDVRIDEAGSDASGQSVSGDIRLGAVTQGSVTLRSVSGDMLVGVRAGSRLWVDAKSTSGDTSSELQVGDAPPEGEGPMIELRATAMSGDIRIVRA
jgi:hypothetical protein